MAQSKQKKDFKQQSQTWKNLNILQVWKKPVFHHFKPILMVKISIANI